MTSEITKIWTGFHKELKGFILKKTRNHADTDDILQEVFIKITQNFDRVNQAKNLKQYVYAIVKNSINDYFRKKNFTDNINEIHEKFSEEEDQSLNEAIANCCIKPLINKLPGIYREALLASEFENMQQKELAKTLNISYSGAKSRVQRGKEKLKELIMDCCNYETDNYGNIIEHKSASCNNCS